jgi:hypothetical protein
MKLLSRPFKPLLAPTHTLCNDSQISKWRMNINENLKKHFRSNIYEYVKTVLEE